MLRLIILITAACLFSLTLAGQDEQVPSYEDTAAVYADLFEIKEPLNLTLKFSVKELQKTKFKETYLPAVMTCDVDENFQVSHDVRIRARGEIRKQICFAPMFWVNIRHAGVEAEDLEDVIKLKMVVRCKSNSLHKSLVLREYLTYQIWNLLSPYGFNTRLVKLKIIDTSRKDKVSEDWAFFIEPEALMAERNNCMSIKNDRLSFKTVNREQMDKVAMFSYMIAQADYSVTGRHNLKILTPKEYGTTGFITVPYDFDYCGLVNAEYAVPGENLGIENVRERFYLGACRSKEDYQKAIEWLASHRDEIIDLINSFEYLEESDKEDMVEYLEEYFEQAEFEKFIERYIQPTCIK